jgi:hypothetical protein
VRSWVTGEEIRERRNGLRRKGRAEKGEAGEGLRDERDGRVWM